MHKVTYLLLVLVFGTLRVPVFHRRIAAQKDGDYKRVNERFPIADYDERGISRPEKTRRGRKRKSVTMTAGGFPSRPQPWGELGRAGVNYDNFVVCTRCHTLCTPLRGM